MTSRSRTHLLFSVPLLLLAAHAFPQGPEAVVESKESSESIFDLIRRGGPIMWPLALCSILGVTFIIERAISLRPSRLAPSGFLGGLFKAFDGSKGEATKGIAYCEREGGACGEIFASGVRNLHRGTSVADESIADTGGRVADRLHRSLGPLKIIAQISPLLGLLGTVYGMIAAFQQLANGTGDTSKSESLAKGIYVALVTTATGLTIAIPVIIGYFLIRRRLEAGTEEIDKMREQFIEHYAASDRELR